MIYWGINALNHGSSIAIFDNDKLVHWKFYSEDEIPLNDYKEQPDKIYWYENPWLKKSRQLYARQWHRVFDFNDIPKVWLGKHGIKKPITYTSHHTSHAAAGYYTSPFDNCAIIVLDAIGEWECATIWHAQNGIMKKLWYKNYPNSLGLFYSAFTHLLGMTPIKDEFLLQQMSDKGNPDRFYPTMSHYIETTVNLKQNLHKGVIDWPFDIRTEQDCFDIASAVQRAFEDNIRSVHNLAKQLTNESNLVYMGGCAMNSKANQSIVEPLWNGIWSLPMPGDPSSAIGAVLYHTRQKIEYEWASVKHIKLKK